MMIKAINEELLMAYADGELDDTTARNVRAAIDVDPELVKRLHQHQQLRKRMQAAYRPALDDPVPEHLLRTALEAPATAAVFDLATRRAARTLRPGPQRAMRHGSWAVWGGMAASLLVGVLIGKLVGTSGVDENFSETSRGLVARGAVAHALTTRLASSPAADQQIALQISFVDNDGRFCRTFTTPVLAGMACRNGEDWAVQSLMQTSAVARTEMRQAGSTLPLELLQMVDQRIRGAALDAQGEAAASQRGWRGSTQR